MIWTPDIERPCPVADRLDAIMEGDWCRACDKRVVDLDTLDPANRLRTGARANDGLCVRYRRPGLVAKLAATALALGIGAPVALAQEQPASPAATIEAQPLGEIIVGGARRLTYEERVEMRREARRIEREERKAARWAAAHVEGTPAAATR